jgi:Abnormal spindle-like microcephaly-assoc'd, ASPM-SPD-2-Hydin
MHQVLCVALHTLQHSERSPLAPTAAEQVVSFTLQTGRLGQIKLPCKVHALGSLLPPTEIILAAKSIGPTISCKNPDDSQCTAISFGKISVLHAHAHVLSLHNESLIPAEITALISSSFSVFSVDWHQCVLEAGESRTITVTVHPDETFTFSDTLCILAANGTELEIPVSATGTGSTLYCEQVQDSKLDFQHQLAGTAFSRKIVIENHGRRTCNAAWQNLENDQIRKKWGKSLRGPEGKPDFTQIPIADRAVFSVYPEKAVIPSKQCLEFMVHGFAPTTGLKQECLQLIAGGQEVCTNIIYTGAQACKSDQLLQKLTISACFAGRKSYVVTECCSKRCDSTAHFLSTNTAV